MLLNSSRSLQNCKYSCHLFLGETQILIKWNYIKPRIQMRRVHILILQDVHRDRHCSLHVSKLDLTYYHISQKLFTLPTTKEPNTPSKPTLSQCRQFNPQINIETLIESLFSLLCNISIKFKSSTVPTSL